MVSAEARGTEDGHARPHEVQRAETAEEISDRARDQEQFAHARVWPLEEHAILGVRERRGARLRDHHECRRQSAYPRNRRLALTSWRAGAKSFAPRARNLPRSTRARTKPLRGRRAAFLRRRWKMARRARGIDRPKLHVVARGARTSPTASDNRLLALLPPQAIARLLPHLEVATLRRNDVLFRAHEPLKAAYFPTSAVVSLVSTLESGESLEVGLIGRDGLAGTPCFPAFTMSCDAIVQIPGQALRIDADLLRREARSNEALYTTLARFAQVLLARSMQMSACNMFHSVEQRCVRWLLAVSDLIDGGDVPLTHDLMATMLGVHRPTVTRVLRSLHTAGLIGERRGVIVVRDRSGLQRVCCECYRAMRDEERRLFG